MIRPDLNLKITTKPSTTERQLNFSKKILLASFTGDSQEFPNIWNIKSRRDYYNNSGEIRLLETFWKSLNAAVNQILILDGYFLNPEVPKNINKSNLIENRIITVRDKLLEVCANGKNGLKIKILTDSPYTSDKEKEQKMMHAFEEIEEFSQENKQQGNTGVEVNLCLSLTRDFDCIHDRFAIIDDELWHFGGTVGGFNSRFSVASRGWDAKALGATSFFNEVWQECNR